jgi:hypothetical protein
MVDLETQQRLLVSTDGDAGPYLMVPLQQVPDIRIVLQGRQIPYSVDRDAIQLDGHPVIAVINFGRGADPRHLQEVLDEVR